MKTMRFECIGNSDSCMHMCTYMHLGMCVHISVYVQTQTDRQTESETDTCAFKVKLFRE